MVEMPLTSTWELVEEQREALEWMTAVNGSANWLNFSGQEARLQPRYTPAIGFHWFWHEGSCFQLRRQEVGMFGELSSGAATFKDKELLTLSCVGRSTESIKELIQCAKADYYNGHSAKTVIKRSVSKDNQRFSARC
jgi:chaperone BCS1